MICGGHVQKRGLKIKDKKKKKEEKENGFDELEGDEANRLTENSKTSLKPILLEVRLEGNSE